MPRQLQTEKYLDQKAKYWPQEGKHILAQYDDETVVVYQAYNPQIASYAAKNKKFLGCPAFNPNRMTWIKTNFLWMMYRCGWNTKKNQERTLAIWLKRSAFEELIFRAVITSYDEQQYGTKENWQKEMKDSPVIVQWDPDHAPDGSREVRRAIQLGLRGIPEFTDGSWFLDIQDITEFVHEQSPNVKQLENLITPSERVLEM